MDDAQDRSMEDDGRTTRQASTSTASHPDRIGPFRILALMGEGAMGIVYEAEQERPRRRVALKNHQARRRDARDAAAVRARALFGILKDS